MKKTWKMNGEVEFCNSCLQPYNNTDRSPKILSCYHTYCKSCLEQFMFKDGVITCLSCGKTTPAETVSSLPENPYLRPENETNNRGRTISSNGEEVYYSDSDDDSVSKPTSKMSPVSGAHHVQGVRDMVINTQKSNIHKIGSILDSNMNKVQSCKQLRGHKERLLKDALVSVERIKKSLDEEYNDNKSNGDKLTGFEAKLKGLKSRMVKIDPMDYKSIKLIHEEAVHIKNSLNAESNLALRQEFDNSLRCSTVKINFEKCDELLAKMQADNDTIFIKLASNLENDTGMIFLTTYLLGKIFSDKISSHNANYKDWINRALMEQGLDAPQPLDDVGEYIEYINQHFKTIKINNPNNEEIKPTNQNSTRPSVSGDASPDEWKVVGTKESKKEFNKVSSFADMAKKPGNPQPAVVKRVPFPEKTIAQTNRPHCYFDIQVDNETPFRVVFELRPDMAPKMVDNFIKLCNGLPDGRGYQGSKIFRAKLNDHILGGDFENDDGTGGHSAYDEKYFLAEQCPLKDQKGAIRMKGLERTIDGRCRVGSQFMIWVGDLEYKEYRFTLVFGRVVEGLGQLQEVSRIKAVQKSPTSWVLRQTVNVVNSGVL